MGMEKVSVLKKMEYSKYQTFFYINLRVTTQKKSRTEIYTEIKEETEGNIIEYHHTEIIDNNKKAKKQWRHSLTRKLKIE